jgi:hypothetical protein
LSFWFYTNLSVPYSLGRLKKVRLKAESGWVYFWDKGKISSFLVLW